MKKFGLIFRHLEESLIVICISYISLCMLLQVFMRRVMNDSLSWSEESIRYVFIWMIFLGLGIGVREGKHICIKALQTALPQVGQKLMNLVSNLIFLAYSAYIFYYSIPVVLSFQEMQQSSPALGIPMHLVYMAAPVGFGLVIIRLLQEIFKDIKNWNKPLPTSNEGLILEEGGEN